MECGVFGREGGDPVRGQSEIETTGLFVENGARHQLTEHLPVDAESCRLFARDPLADCWTEQHHLPVVGEAIVGRRDACVACGENDIARRTAEDLADIPQTAKESTRRMSSSFATQVPAADRSVSSMTRLFSAPASRSHPIDLRRGNNALRAVSIAFRPLLVVRRHSKTSGGKPMTPSIGRSSQETGR